MTQPYPTDPNSPFQPGFSPIHEPHQQPIHEPLPDEPIHPEIPEQSPAPEPSRPM